MPSATIPVPDTPHSSSCRERMNLLKAFGACSIADSITDPSYPFLFPIFCHTRFRVQAKVSYAMRIQKFNNRALGAPVLVNAWLGGHSLRESVCVQRLTLADWFSAEARIPLQTTIPTVRRNLRSTCSNTHSSGKALMWASCLFKRRRRHYTSSRSPHSDRP